MIDELKTFPLARVKFGSTASVNVNVNEGEKNLPPGPHFVH